MVLSKWTRWTASHSSAAKEIRSAWIFNILLIYHFLPILWGECPGMLHGAFPLSSLQNWRRYRWYPARQPINPWCLFGRSLAKNLQHLWKDNLLALNLSHQVTTMERWVLFSWSCAPSSWIVPCGSPSQNWSNLLSFCLPCLPACAIAAGTLLRAARDKWLGIQLDVTIFCNHSHNPHNRMTIRTRTRAATSESTAPWLTSCKIQSSTSSTEQ